MHEPRRGGGTLAQGVNPVRTRNPLDRVGFTPYATDPPSLRDSATGSQPLCLLHVFLPSCFIPCLPTRRTYSCNESIVLWCSSCRAMYSIT